MKALRSLFRICWIVLRELAQAALSLLRGDTASAAGHVRVLALSTHEDLLNTIVAVQRRLPFWRQPAPDLDRILIVKLDRIGDMVTTTPVFAALRELFPNARLDIVGHPLPLSLLEGDERIGERLHYRSWIYHPLAVLPPGPRDWWLILKLLWRRYPFVVYLRGSHPFLFLGLTSRFAASKYIVAEPTIQRYHKALERVLGPVPVKPQYLHVTPESARFAAELVHRSNGQGGPVVTIHAAASSATKIWPPERFAGLADELYQRYRAQVHFLGGPGDRPILESIGRLAQHAHSYHWSLRLPQVSGLIQASHLFIGNDSGLAHMASALGTPLVVLWGSANLPMACPQAPAEKMVILYHELACRDVCLEFKCINANPYECLLRTQLNDVLDAASRLLEGKASRSLPVVLAGNGVAGARG